LDRVNPTRAAAAFQPVFKPPEAAMHTHPLPQAQVLEWQRVGAWSAAIAAHVVAAALVAMPPAPLPPTAHPRTVDVLIREAPPPPPPIPPEVLPMPKPKALPVPPVPRPVRREVMIATDPPVPVDAPLAPSGATVPTTTDDIGTSVGGGASRELDWAAPLRLRYPPPALRARLQGEVMLNVLVDAQGRAQQVEVARSSGHRVLDIAAREAVLGARFRPVLRDGVAVPAWGVVPIRFRLDEA